MKIKIVTSFLIFMLLFIAAWQLDKKGKPEFFVPEVEEETVEVVPINYNINQVQKKKLKVFQAREYVRIVAS